LAPAKHCRSSCLTERPPSKTLDPRRRPIVNKPLGIAYGTGELPAMIASRRDRKFV
jgi:hypothetical protein